MLYEVKNVYKTYKTKSYTNHVLNNINLKIKGGDVVVILGPSGSGKSTLLNILSGIDRPTKGQVYFKKKRIDIKNELQLTKYRRENLGFIFQNYNLIPTLTVKENIELGASLTKNSLDINELLDNVNLKNHKNKYPYQLSGGEQQRVAIARSLSKNPDVLFCDEPTGALDEENGKRVLKILQDMNEKYNTTLIIVTHNPSIADMANTVIKMNSGKIIEIKKNKTIKNANELRWG